MRAVLRLLGWSVITAGLLVAILGGTGYWLYNEAERPGPLAETRSVVVPAHSGISTISELLTANGVIRYPLVFDLVAKVSGRGTSLKAGEYEFPAGVSVVMALDVLASGRTIKRRLTIPEGLTSAEVVALVRDAPALDGETGPPPLEGELYPDTYTYTFGEQRKDLIDRMRRAMAHALAQVWADRRADLPLSSPQEVLVLASIIEKETPREEERAHISGVFINRLRLGMRLQADPTVLFAMGSSGQNKLDRPLAHADLSYNSPYNTYVAKGLPPGPIANPGRSSLRAAVRPERTEDLYFVADGSGGHAFAKTLADQNRNINLYRRTVAADPEPDPRVRLPEAKPADVKPIEVKPIEAKQPGATPAAVPATSAARHPAPAAKKTAGPAGCRPTPQHPCPR